MADRVKLLLSANAMDAESSEPVELRFLERYCCLCARQLTNQQDWRRRMKKEHAAAWREAEKKISSTASSIQISRPCRFCRLNFTKTPQLHTQKCLPLLQLAFLDQHGGHSGAQRSGAPVGSNIPDGSTKKSSEEELTQDKPNKYPKEEGQTRGRTGKRTWEPRSVPTRLPNQQLQQLARVVARHETALQMLEADRRWVLFVDPGEVGIIPQLMLTTASWKKSRAQSMCNCGLRQALMSTLLTEAVARMQELSADQSAQQRLSKVKLLTAEPLA